MRNIHTLELMRRKSRFFLDLQQYCCFHCLVSSWMFEAKNYALIDVNGTPFICKALLKSEKCHA